MKKIFLIVITLICSTALFAQDNELQGSKQMQNPMLTQPIMVTIGGDFIVTGSFSASKFQRLDHFVTTIYTQAKLNSLGNLTQLETIKEVQNEIERYALRDILLKRITGEEIKIDLLKFRLTGNFDNNPYLRSDDVIVFPAYDVEKNIIDISGAVNKSTKFQFVKGDKLSDAVLFACGLNSAYENIDKAEISRLDATGNSEQVLLVNIKDDIELKSGDRIRILADENQRKNYKVLVLGEVKYPGYVYVTKHGTLLKEVIKKAGGFKPTADLVRSEVVRDYNSIEILRKYQLTQDYLDNPNRLLLPETQLRMKQQKELLEMSRLSNLVDEDSVFFTIDNQLRALQSESLVDFSKLAEPDSDEANFIVKDGDLILVPDKFDYVYVFGQVPKAGYVKYEANKNYKYYIEKSGGLSETAREEDEIVVIKGKGKDWVSKEKEKLKIEPGDYIYVPKEIPRTFWYSFQRISIVASVAGSIATIILLLTQFGK